MISTSCVHYEDVLGSDEDPWFGRRYSWQLGVSSTGGVGGGPEGNEGERRECRSEEREEG